MTEREVAELRRRFKADKSNITRIRGCYVNASGEQVCTFDQSMVQLGQEEWEMVLGNLRRTLSGTLGKNLLELEFDTQQVAYGEEHRLLMTLRNSQLEDEEALDAFYRKVSETVRLEENYLILLACDTYDVPYRARDGEVQEDRSADVFRYIVCSICPVKLTKAALSFLAHENRFDHLSPDWAVSPPELGFLFPAFDERATNLYNALYYTKSAGEDHREFIDAVFRTPAPIPADVQKESFQSALGGALAEDCSYQVVQAVHDSLRGMIEEHKANKLDEPLTVSRGAVEQVLKSCGVAEDRVERFGEQYDRAFGEEASLPPRNLVDPRQLEIVTPDVTIRVHPDRGDLVETRIIDGARYILIRAEEDVTVNGVPVQIV